MLRYGAASEIMFKKKIDAELSAYEIKAIQHFEYQKGEIEYYGPRQLMLTNSESEERRLYFKKYRERVRQFLEQG